MVNRPVPGGVASEITVPIYRADDSQEGSAEDDFGAAGTKAETLGPRSRG